MEPHEFLVKARALAHPFRVTDGTDFRLKHFDPAETLDFDREDDGPSKAAELLAEGTRHLSNLQDTLYAQDRWSLLIVFQAMDAAGKDGAIKHVMSGVNPQGCQVFSFKAPNTEELDHDFLWRCARCLPERGRIGIFNRSHYEEVLVVRVHPELLDHQKLPKQVVTKHIWKERYQDIRGFERHLARSGTRMIKFFLNVSKKEQKKRFLERLETPEKNWKYSPDDVRERAHWREYMKAYEEAIRATATKEAPWYVVPADDKGFTRLVVAAVIVTTLADLDLAYPKLDPAQRADVDAARRALKGDR